MAEALTADLMPVPHGFFTRRGGVSTGPFASLNCSLSSPDDPDRGAGERARAARSLGVDPALLGLTQVHGDRGGDGDRALGSRAGRHRRTQWYRPAGGGAGDRHGRLRAGAVRRCRGAESSARRMPAGAARWPACWRPRSPRWPPWAPRRRASPRRSGLASRRRLYEVGADLRDAVVARRRQRCGVLRAGPAGGTLAVRPGRVLCGQAARGRRRPGHRDRHRHADG